MRSPMTLQYPVSDPLAAQLAAELATELPLLTIEPYQGKTITLLDGWGNPAGIHFEGAPQGQERQALVNVVLDISRGGGELSPVGRAQARALAGELWVLSVPT